MVKCLHSIAPKAILICLFIEVKNCSIIYFFPMNISSWQFERVLMAKFNFEEERVKQEIERLEARRVLIQLPEGLKREGPRLAAIVEEAGAVPIVSADPITSSRSSAS